ncbi:MAG: hypothetical protein Q8P56_01035 [Candidatus Uhrbacteria bacterium]|nr:hypothetical protein [Candidatus Uhrbacteria bacterium]
MAQGAEHVSPLEDVKPEEMEVPENDVFRQAYTPLTDEQKEQGNKIKKAAQALWDAMDETVADGERSERARLVAVGKTQLELAVMAAVKGVYSEIE